MEGSALLLATGRKGNTAGLGLEAAGIAVTATGIAVDASLRTGNRRVYAIGDAAGGLQFTHAANYHASLVLREILFRLPARENRDIVPRATFTDPEIAAVGLGEDEARKRHGHVDILRWPYAENDRAQAERATAGLIKIIAGRRGKILGVSIVGAGCGRDDQHVVDGDRQRPGAPPCAQRHRALSDHDGDWKTRCHRLLYAPDTKAVRPGHHPAAAALRLRRWNRAT